MPRSEFDDEYYRKFYDDDPVHTASKIATLASAVHSLADWWDIPIESVLDIGAGPGYWRDWYASNHPSVTYVSTDVSAHACEQYGHEQRDIVTWTPETSFDLVVCHGVLHYIPSRQAEVAIENIASACHGLLYLEAPTSWDLDNVVDQEATDMSVTRRSARWYRQRLAPHFVQIGAGIWVSRRRGLPLYELEHAPDSRRD